MGERDHIFTAIGAITAGALVFFLCHHAGTHDPTKVSKHHRGGGRAADPTPNPASCSSPFGSFNGIANNVTARSNCNDDYTSYQSNSALLASFFSAEDVDSCDWSACPSEVFMGMTWQCVEYGRRYIVHHYQAVFGSINGAADIWPLPNVTRYVLNRTLSSSKHHHPSKVAGASCTCQVVQEPWATVSNNASTDVWVQVGDLVIYDRGSVGPYGHVCAVVGINPLSLQEQAQYLSKHPHLRAPVAEVLVGEQNWNNALWPVATGPGAFARKLLLTPSGPNGHLQLVDQQQDGLYPIFGVKRVINSAAWEDAKDPK